MKPANLKQYKTIRTTVTLPTELAERSQRLVDAGLVPSRSALIVNALEKFLAELEQREIDRHFAAMADDEAYQTLNEEMAEAFAESDWEALVLLDEDAP